MDRRWLLQACRKSRDGYNSTKVMRTTIIVLIISCFCAGARSAEWVQTNKPLWGLRGGLQFALHPAGFGRGDGGPRGLIRIGAPVTPDGQHILVNFIAIEPIVNGRRGFSELDGVNGRRLWAGELKRSAPAHGVEQIEVPVTVEKFRNGASVRLLVSQRNDAPDELRFTVHTAPDSAKMEMCILTATMGNLARTRQLWLRNEVLSSRKLYPDYRDDNFAPHTMRSLANLTRTASGDVVVAVTGDEANPAAVFPFPGRRAWHYGGVPVTQYWRMSKEHISEDLRAVVNARFTYWQSKQPIPGGIAFENFELNTRFRDGQQFIFGITRRSPAELGITPSNSK